MASLEKTPTLFYSRLTQIERKTVKQIVGVSTRFLYNKQVPIFMIAGVGGILRRSDPSVARDIDLAVVCYDFVKERSYLDLSWKLSNELESELNNVKAYWGSSYNGPITPESIKIILPSNCRKIDISFISYMSISEWKSKQEKFWNSWRIENDDKYEKPIPLLYYAILSEYDKNNSKAL